MFKCLQPIIGCKSQKDHIERRHNNLDDFPDDILRYSRSLEELHLDSNQIERLPREFARLTKLRHLTLSDNKITRLPNTISNFVNLAELDVSKNEICEIPEGIKFCRSLQLANFSANPISRLPDTFIHLVNLVSLILNDVTLTELPHDIGLMRSLQTLELRENLIKDIPSSLVDLEYLESLDLGSNEIEVLPENIGKLQRLKELYLDINDISDLPDDIGELRHLQCLDVAENKLEMIPDTIGFLYSLTDLTLTQNFISEIPHSIGRLKKLVILKLALNRLSYLPNTIGDCESLRELYVTDNCLEDLPDSLANLSQLWTFNADKNRIASIPEQIGNCRSLGILSLRDNLISIVPDSVSELINLSVLDVSGNKLDFLPHGVSTLPRLKAVWLSENQGALSIPSFSADKYQGKEVLTCFLLPQQPGSMENLLRGSVNTEDIVNSSPIHLNDIDTREREIANERVMFEGTQLEKESAFKRHGTPHPRELKARHAQFLSKLQESGALEETHPEFSRMGGGGDPHEAPLAATDDDGLFDGSEEERDTTGGFDEDDEEVKMFTEQRVEFAPDVIDNEHMDEEGPLKRRDTPHYLKGKRINLGSASEEIVERLMTEINRNRSISQSSNAPLIPDDSYEVPVSIERQSGGLGISIAGGLGSTPFRPNDQGVFISKLVAGGPAEQSNLRIGDKLVSVCGERLPNDVTHQAAVDILKTCSNKRRIDLIVSRVRCASPSDVFESPKPVEAPSAKKRSSVSFAPEPAIENCVEKEIVTLERSPDSSFGFSITCSQRGGAVQISKINENSPAYHSNKLSVGDHIYSINDQLMSNLSYEQVISILKSTTQLKIAVTRQVKVIHDIHNVKAAQSAIMDLPRPVLKRSNDSSFDRTDVEEIVLEKSSNPLGLSIIGGVDHLCRAFGNDCPGIFVSKIVAGGAASKTNLQIGDRILSVNGVDVSRARHNDAVQVLLGGGKELRLLVRHELPPNGLKEVVIEKFPGEKLGLIIRGGVNSSPGNPLDPSDEGIFIVHVTPGHAADNDGRLAAGQRLLEVNGRNLSGASHAEAVSALRSASTKCAIVVCDGFPSEMLLHRSNLDSTSSTEDVADFSIVNGSINNSAYQTRGDFSVSYFCEE